MGPEEGPRTRLRVAVTGVGWIGKIHADILAHCDFAELAAVIDTDPERGSNLARVYGVPYFPTVEEALPAKVMDACVIAVPDHAHVEPTEQLLLAGVPVLVEKPIAHTVHGAQRLLEVARRKQSRIMVGHTVRFDPRYRLAARAVATGDIGETVHLNAHRICSRDLGTRVGNGTSPILHLGIHDIDAVQWITGRRIESVYAETTSRIMPSCGVQAADVVLVTCRSQGGVIGQLRFGWTMPTASSPDLDAGLEIFGSIGSVHVRHYDTGVRVSTAGTSILPDAVHFAETVEGPGGILREELRHFALALRTDREFVIPVEDAVDAVVVAEAIARSVSSGVRTSVEAARRS